MPWSSCRASSTGSPASGRAFSGSTAAPTVPGLARFNAFATPTKVQPVPTSSEEHTSELQVTNAQLVCRLLIEQKKKRKEDIARSENILHSIRDNIRKKNRI